MAQPAVLAERAGLVPVAAARRRHCCCRALPPLSPLRRFSRAPLVLRRSPSRALFRRTVRRFGARLCAGCARLGTVGLGALRAVRIPDLPAAALRRLFLRRP